MKRCRCRPGCLTFVEPADDLIATEHGDALAVHIDPSLAYPTEPLFDLADLAAAAS